jgi:hypothetical protein
LDIEEIKPNGCTLVDGDTHIDVFACTHLELSREVGIRFQLVRQKHTAPSLQPTVSIPAPDLIWDLASQVKGPFGSIFKGKSKGQDVQIRQFDTAAKDVDIWSMEAAYNHVLSVLPGMLNVYAAQLLATAAEARLFMVVELPICSLHGALYDDLLPSFKLPIASKLNMMFIVASTLATVHSLGLAYGELDLTRVMLCASDSGSFVAKLDLLLFVVGRGE